MLQVTKIEVKSGSPSPWSLVMPVQKTCGHCAEPFSVPSRRSETVKFCSLKCKTAAKRVTLTCAGCGSSFEREKHLAVAKYCSRACFHSATKGVPQAARSERHSCICEYCAESFEVIVSRKDTARFCSRSCQSKSPAFRREVSEAQRGEKSHRWTGGLYQGKQGYVRIKGHGLNSKKFHFKHRIVIEAAMLEMEPNHPFLVEVDGRKTLDGEIEVHHIDRDRSNNAFTNLLAVTKDAHAQIHHRNRTPKPWECWPHRHVSADSAQSTNSEKDSAMREIT